MQFFKNIARFLLICFSIIILLFNFRIYYSPDFVERGESEYNEDVYHQLQHLRKEMYRGAASDMQSVYPEGFVFQNCLYGLIWAEYATDLSKEDLFLDEAIEEIDRTIKENGKSHAKATFSTKTSLKYGAFYIGWTSYLEGRRLKLRNHKQEDSVLIQNFQKNCEAIAQTLSTSQTPYLETYPRFAWPADMILCIASLKLHDDIFEPKYEETIAKWIVDVEARTDTLGLMPHSMNPQTDLVKEPARGSSQSLILQFMAEIDPVYGKEKFEIYKEHFLTSRLGLPGVREYPKGTPSEADIDSGPVIWNIGGAASIVGQRTFALYDDHETAIGLRNSIESFGLGKTIGKKKNYLFGVLPMADAFIGWANAFEYNQAHKLSTGSYWRLNFQLLSLLILCIFIFLVYKLRKSNK